MEYVAGGFCILLAVFMVAFFAYGISAEVKRERSKKRALAEGEELVAWIVQAPPEMYERGKAIAWPVQVFVSFAGPGHANSEQLSDIAARAVELLRRPPRTPAEREVAEILADTRYRPEVRHPLPIEFTGGLRVWACQVAVQPSLMPEGHLTLPYVYCKAMPGEEGWLWMVKYPDEIDTEDGHSTPKG
jgi:hypothetical protein